MTSREAQWKFRTWSNNRIHTMPGAPSLPLALKLSYHHDQSCGGGFGAHVLLDATVHAFRVWENEKGSPAEEDQNSRKNTDNEQWRLDTVMVPTWTFDRPPLMRRSTQRTGRTAQTTCARPGGT